MQQAGPNPVDLTGMAVILTIEQFKAELENAKKLTRAMMYKGFRFLRIYSPTSKEGDATTLGYPADHVVFSLFGDTFRWIMDPVNKEMYEIRRAVECQFKPDSSRLSFPLFMLHSMELKHRMSETIKEMMEMYMSQHGMISMRNIDKVFYQNPTRNWT